MKKLQVFWKHATTAWKLTVFNAVITIQVLYGLDTTWLLKRDLLRGFIGYQHQGANWVSTKANMVLAIRIPGPVQQYLATA